jgi:hypothetical protein
MTDTAVGARADRAAQTLTGVPARSGNQKTADRRAAGRQAVSPAEIPSGLSPAYGLPGWTVTHEVWEVVGEFMSGGRAPWLDDDGHLVPLDTNRQALRHCAHQPSPHSQRASVPVVESFQRLDGAAAAVLLDRLTPAQLRARTAGAPSVQCLLEATAANPGDVFLDGIAARPGSAYEGIAISSICVLDPYAVHDAFGVPDSGCLGSRERDEVWAAVRAMFDLGDGPPPMVTDPVRTVPDGVKGWWLGWI